MENNSNNNSNMIKIFGIAALLFACVAIGGAFAKWSMGVLIICLILSALCLFLMNASMKKAKGEAVDLEHYTHVSNYVGPPDDSMRSDVEEAKEKLRAAREKARKAEAERIAEALLDQEEEEGQK